MKRFIEWKTKDVHKFASLELVVDSEQSGRQTLKDEDTVRVGAVRSCARLEPHPSVPPPLRLFPLAQMEDVHRIINGENAVGLIGPFPSGTVRPTLRILVGTRMWDAHAGVHVPWYHDSGSFVPPEGGDAPDDKAHCRTS